MSDILQNIVKWKIEVFIDLYVKPNFARKSLKSPLDLFKKQNTISWRIDSRYKYLDLGLLKPR